MTTLGKILVFLNFVLSIAGAACAMGIYTNRINWTGKAAADGTKGRIPELAERINQLLGNLAASEARYTPEPARLYEMENKRAAAKESYRGQLARLLDSKDDDFCQEVVLVNGVVAMNPQPQVSHLPQLQFAKDRFGGTMPPVRAQLRLLTKMQDAIHEVMKDIDKAHKTNALITAQIIGDKGLRERIAAEQAKARKIDETIARRDTEKGIKDGELRARARDYEVERFLIAERNQQLEKRLQELEKVGVARQP